MLNKWQLSWVWHYAHTFDALCLKFTVTLQNGRYLCFLDEETKA